MRLVTVIIREAADESGHLYAGHAGILFPADENEFYFLEKLGFREPHQLTMFRSRAELKDYLVQKYGTDAADRPAAPFVTENDMLMGD